MRKVLIVVAELIGKLYEDFIDYRENGFQSRQQSQPLQEPHIPRIQHHPFQLVKTVRPHLLTVTNCAFNKAGDRYVLCVCVLCACCVRCSGHSRFRRKLVGHLHAGQNLAYFLKHAAQQIPAHMHPNLKVITHFPE